MSEFDNNQNNPTPPLENENRLAETEKNGAEASSQEKENADIASETSEEASTESVPEEKEPEEPKEEPARPTESYNPYGAPRNDPNRGMYNGQSPYRTPEPPKKKNEIRMSKGGLALLIVCCLALSLFASAGMNAFFNTSSPMETTTGALETTLGETTLPGTETTAATTPKETAPAISTGAVEGVASSTYTAIAKECIKSVVVINVTETTISYGQEYTTGGAGSGVIYTKDGYIITNNHVICDDSGTNVADNITVRLTNGEEYKATAIGADADSDIAVLKIEAENLTFAVAGNSDNLAVGEEVVVVGNPLGELGGTVTNGIVSATEREMDVNGVTMHLIQSNAAVNPGNSGGGMFNMKGELIGIVNAKSSGTGIEGLGFAIPINEALDINAQLLQYGYVRGKVMIGVGFDQVENSSSMFMYYYNVKPGLYVTSLTEGYNDSVLQVGDRVIAVNGEEVTTVADVKAIVSAASVGDKLKFQLYRDGKLIGVEVTCYEKVPDGMTGADIQFDGEEQPPQP